MLRVLPIALSLTMIATTATTAHAEDTRARSPLMVAVGIGTLVTASGQGVVFGLLAAMADAQGHTGCGVMGPCGSDQTPLMVTAATGVGLAVAGLATGIVLIAVGAKRVPAETLALTPSGVSIAF